MSEVTLIAKPGREPGSRSSGRLRTVGQVPAVVYGHGITPVAVAVDWRELRAALTTEAGTNALINLQVDGDSHLTIVRDMQRHPIRHDVLHVDFQVVDRDQIIHVDVPIILVGESESVKETVGATVEQTIYSLTVKSKPGNIPNDITIDISELQVGNSIRVGDLPLPAGVETDVDPEEAVVTTTVVQAEPEPELEGEELAEGEEGVEGEAAQGEGEAPAAEGGEGEPAETSE